MKSFFKTDVHKQLILLSIIFLSVILVAPKAEAKPPDYNGGVSNEYTYEEYFFLADRPILFKGKATITEKENKGQMTSTYRFTLDGPGGAKLTRSVSYVADLDNHQEKSQTTSNAIVKSFSEKITLTDKTTYTLDDYQFTHGTVIDNLPASDYYSGNALGRKIYKIKEGVAPKKEYLITVHFTGRNMGYENFWGATETQLIDYEIVFPNGQSGFVTSRASDSKSRILQYEPHDPSLSSFTGGHAVISESNMISEYKYNLPSPAGVGTINLTKKNTPKIERLIVPKFRDLNKHWAKDHIEKLYSLGVFDESTQFFSPNTPMKRYQYTVGILKAVDIRVLEDPKKKKVVKKAIFKDLNVKEKDYPYIESAVEKGIITGVTPDIFNPDGPITRVQAVAILVRALGMEGRAPSPGFRTQFVDDHQISDWAKDSVYVATELGLVSGDELNRFNPQQPLTRAHAAALTSRFLDFLENDLKQNYRDDILFFD